MHKLELVLLEWKRVQRICAMVDGLVGSRLEIKVGECACAFAGGIDRQLPKMRCWITVSC